MILPKGQQLLLPVSPAFIVASLLVALALDLLPLGRVAWTPDWLMVLLAFWGMHQPQRVGMGVAFVLGLCIDVHQSTLLGQHALVYCALVFGVQLLQRRLLWFGPFAQALQLLPLFVGAHVLLLVLRLLGAGVVPGWSSLAAPLLEALIWPLASVLLLAPQRRPPDQDDNRPL
ncbi:MAG: rod shape-determining protein MreD [Comamonadaceae bacterium]|nr:rod shape-determining protein MreD [Burkholderiales bacterium]MEB2349490.1 rod shape-determining protein MreD [Comamonadaceae bacterium]